MHLYRSPTLARVIGELVVDAEQRSLGSAEFGEVIAGFGEPAGAGQRICGPPAQD